MDWNEYWAYRPITRQRLGKHIPAGQRVQQYDVYC
jgi:hypothetical protein